MSVHELCPAVVEWRRRQPGRLPGRSCAPLPAAGLLHRRRHGGSHSEGQHHPLARAHQTTLCVVSRRRRRRFSAGGLLVHDRAAVRGHLPQGRGHRTGDHVPVLRAGRQHHGAGLHRQHPWGGFRRGALSVVPVVRHRHRPADGSAVLARRCQPRCADRCAVRRQGEHQPQPPSACCCHWSLC